MCPHVLARVGALHVRRRPAQQGTPVGAVVRVQRALCAALSAPGALWSVPGALPTGAGIRCV